MAAALAFAPATLGLIPLDEEEKKRAQKRQPAGDRYTPENLGLEPVDDNTNDNSPDALGLLPVEEPPDRGQGQAAPGSQESAPASEEDSWLAWADHKRQQFLDTLTETFGGEEKPRPAPDMTVVAPPEGRDPKPEPESKDQTFFEAVGDWLVPDNLEPGVKWLGDTFGPSKEWTQRQAQSGEAGLYASGAGLMRLSKNTVGVLNYVNDFLVENTGIGQKSDQRDDIIGQSWTELQQRFAKAEEAYNEQYAKTRLPEEQRGWMEATSEGLAQVPAAIAEYGAAISALGPVAGFAGVDALMHADEGVEGAAVAGAKGAILGGLLGWANVLSRPMRALFLGGVGAGAAALEGADKADIIASGVLFPLLGLPAKRGPIDLKYLKEHGVTRDLADLGGHVRDLLIGGDVKNAQARVDRAQATLDKVRTDNATEMDSARARSIATYREIESRPGEDGFAPTQRERLRRQTEAHRASKDIIEGQKLVNARREMEARHRLENEQRRLRRIQEPLSVGLSVAPHARALQIAEREALVTEQRAFEEMRHVNAEADKRVLDAKAEAQKLRRQEAKTPQERQRNLDLADHLEAEGERVSFEIRRQAEDRLNERITRAQEKAGRARDMLMERLLRGSKRSAGRAALMTGEREVVEANKQGVRKIGIGVRRAERLVEMGDETVRRAKERAEADGIKPDDPKTEFEYKRRIEAAEAIREKYRQKASEELLDAQYAADAVISLAQMRLDAAKKFVRRMLDRARSKRNAIEENDPTQEITVSGPEMETTAAEYRMMVKGLRERPELAGIADDVDPILERIRNPEDVLPAINRVAREHGDFNEARRGVQTKEKREALAEEIGMSEEQFVDTPYGKAFNDAELEAAKTITRRAYQDMRRKIERAKRSGKTEDRIAAREAVLRFTMIVERLRGAAAEAGRALRMFRDIKKEFGSSSEYLSDDALDRIMSYDTPGTAYNIAKKALRGDWFGMLTEWWIQGLLSSFQTSVVNILSGVNMLAWKPAQALVAWGVGVSRWAFRNSVWNVIMAPFKAIGEKLYEDHLMQTDLVKWQEYKTRKEQARDRDHPHPDRVELMEVGLRLWGYFEALMEAPLVALRSWMGERYLGETTYGPGYTEHIPSFTVPGTRGRFGAYGEGIKIGGAQVRWPSKILQVIDDFFKVFFYRSALHAHAWRQAGYEGYTGAKRVDRYRELMRHPSERMTSQARREALEGTFQKPVSGKFPQAVQQAASSSRAFRFLMPFSRALLNSVEFILTGTPLAPIYKEARMDLSGFNGRYKQDMAIAHMMIGTGIATMVYLWALGGNARPMQGKDQKAQGAGSISGLPPYAIRIPGTDQWVTLNRVDPLGGFLALGISAADVHKNAVRSGDKEASKKAFAIFQAAAYTMIMDRAGMRGLQNFMDAMQGGQYGTSSKAAATWWNRLLAQIAVPQGVAVYARTKDPYLRRAETLMENIRNRIPGEREKLFPVRNVWGDPIKAYESYDYDIYDLFMPIYTGKPTRDRVSHELLVLYEKTGWFPGFVQKRVANRQLTAEEYDYYTRTAGKLAYTVLLQDVKARNFQMMTLAQKKAHVQAIFRDARKQARELLKAKYPDLMKRPPDKVDPQEITPEYWGWFDTEQDGWDRSEEELANPAERMRQIDPETSAPNH